MKRFKVFGTVASLLLSILTVGLVAVPANAVATCNFAGGTGTAADPYQVATPAQLHSVHTCIDSSTYKYYVQTQDIDLTPSSEPWNDLALGGWSPIGDSSLKFYGTYDGRGNSIKNLTINRDGPDQGLFGWATGSIIKNLNIGSDNISDAGSITVTGSNATAVLVGHTYVTTIENVHVKNTSLTGHNMTGTIIGWSEVSNVSNCSNSGTVSNILETPDTNSIGGLIGTAYNSRFENLEFSGQLLSASSNNTGGILGGGDFGISIINSSVSGHISVDTTMTRVGSLGGIAGSLGGSSLILNSTFTGEITDSSQVDTNDYSSDIGGLVGGAYSGLQISKSYAVGAITAAEGNQIGGLVGYADIAIAISNSFSTSAISGADKVGGLIGYMERPAISIQHSFFAGAVTSPGTDLDPIANGSTYRTITTNQNNTFDASKSGLNNSTTLIEGFETASMKTKSTFVGLGFDFDSAQPVWAIDSTINDGYPFLVGSPLDTRTNSGGGSSGDSNSGSAKTVTNTVVTPATESLGTFAFAPGSSKLSAKAKAKLNTLAKSIKAASYKQLTVRAYTSETDTKLSVARAKAISSYLKKKGVKVTVVNEAITRSSKSLNYKVKIFGKK